MRHSTRPRPSKLAITLSFFFLQTLSLPAPTTALEERAWRPDSELPGAKFVLGDGKAQGSKVKGYEGEWPLWSSLRTSKPALDSIDAVAPAGRPGPSSSSSSSTTSSTGSNDSISYVCAPIGECEACPDDVIHLPYCRPYNNRRRVACSPVTDRNDPIAIQAALDAAIAVKTSSTSSATTATTTTTTTKAAALLGWEACGKSAKQEARDYFEMIAVVASIAIFSVWAFIQRQKLLFRRQNQRLESRVTGRRASGPTPSSSSSSSSASAAALLQGGRKKRAARLATS